MLCSFQLLPHANIKYQEARERLARAELICLMRKAGISTIPEISMIGGYPFFRFVCDSLDASQLRMLSRHSCLGLLTEESDGCFHPLDKDPADYLSRDLPEVLKYKGKTSTEFTRMMLNIALACVTCSTDTVPLVLDPMCGKGTTLFCAMQWGMDAVGIEINRNDLKETMDYLNRYFQLHRLKYSLCQGSVTIDGTGIDMAEYGYAADKHGFQNGSLRNLRLFAGDTACADRLL